MKGRKSF